MGDQLDGCYDAKSVLLVPDLLQPELLDVRDSFKNCRVGPFKIIVVFSV